MCIGSQAPRTVDSRAAAQELAVAEQELESSQNALREARAQLSDAKADAKNAERMLADLDTAIPKVGAPAACPRLSLRRMPLSLSLAADAYGS